MEQEIKAQEGGIRATIQVTRKDTGIVETYDLIQIPEPKGEENGSHPHDNS